MREAGYSPPGKPLPIATQEGVSPYSRNMKSCGAHMQDWISSTTVTTSLA